MYTHTHTHHIHVFKKEKEKNLHRKRKVSVNEFLENSSMISGEKSTTKIEEKIEEISKKVEQRDTELKKRQRSAGWISSDPREKPWEETTEQEREKM